jgi:hypothetical protein
MTEQRLSSTGERIDVGIDVHKEAYTVTCLCQRQMVGFLPEATKRYIPAISR